MSLLDITSVYQMGDRTLAIQTSERALKLQPLLIKFGGDLEMMEFQADLVHGMNSVHGISTAPSSPGSIYSVTSRGEVMVFDPRVSLNDSEAMGKAPGEEETRFMQEIPVKGFDLPLVRVLENGFSKGSVLALKFWLHEDCQR